MHNGQEAAGLSWKMRKDLRMSELQVTELIIGSLAGMDEVNQEVLDKLSQALTDFMQTTLD